MWMYHLAPAGTPVSIPDLACWLQAQFNQSGVLEEFRQSICDRYGVRYCFFVSTGRAAFSLALEAMRELTPGEKDEVIIPSYTCYSVPASVARAGLKVRICDIDPRTLDYDYAALEQADFTRVLCVASANLYGIPNDLPRLTAIARKTGTLVLDDAAQSMEAKVHENFSGTLGDVGIFSLDKGKNITSIDGGIIVTNRDNLGSLLQAKVAALPKPSLKTRLLYLIKLLVYSSFLHPRLYWIPNGIPLLKLGSTRYTVNFLKEAYPVFLASIGKRLFDRIGLLTASRIEKARLLIDRLKGLDDIQSISYPSYILPVFLRLPLLIKEEHRNKLMIRLKQAGIGASTSYPTAIVDIPNIDSNLFRGSCYSEAGRWVARRILTLPTHSYVTIKNMDRMARILDSKTTDY